MELPSQNLEIVKTKERMTELDKKVERNNLNNSELEEWAMMSSKLTELEKLASMDIKQKSIIKWLIDGDENTRFFHGFVNNRNQKKSLERSYDKWCTVKSTGRDERVNFQIFLFKIQGEMEAKTRVQKH